MLFLTLMPLWLSAFVLVVIPTALAMVGPIVIRRFVTLDRLRTNNEVAGFKVRDRRRDLRGAARFRHHHCLGEIQ